MFSDLSARPHCRRVWTPEDLREFISAYQKCVAHIVQRCGGFVAKYMGDQRRPVGAQAEAHRILANSGAPNDLWEAYGKLANQKGGPKPLSRAAP
jgi:class 3 adenylate cyclase